MTKQSDTKADLQATATPRPKTKPTVESSAPAQSHLTTPVDSPSAESADDFDEATYLRGRFVLFNALPSAITSGVIHFIAFLILALTVIQSPRRADTFAIDAGAGHQADVVEQLEEQILAPAPEHRDEPA